MTSQVGLADAIIAATESLRKGPEREERSEYGITVIHLWNMPHVDEWEREKVDVHFFAVGITDMADELKPVVAQRIREWPELFVLLAPGPSYLDAGRILGSQELALLLFGLGEYYKWWQVITPERMSIFGPDGERMAGNGFVMTSGMRAAFDE